MEIMKVSVTALLFRGLPNRGRLDQPPTNKLDLNRLRARMGEKPRTKVGQIRQAWPDIKALFDAGHSLKDIWMWLNEIGIEIGYARLSDYIGQLKRRDQTAAPAATLPFWLASHPSTARRCPLRLRARRGKARRSPRGHRRRMIRLPTSGSGKTGVQAFNTTPSPTLKN